MSLSEGAVGLHQSHICRLRWCLCDAGEHQVLRSAASHRASNGRSVISCFLLTWNRRCWNVQISPWMGYTRRAVWVRQWLVFHMHRSLLHTCWFSPSFSCFCPYGDSFINPGTGAQETYAERPHGVMVELEPGWEVKALWHEQMAWRGSGDWSGEAVSDQPLRGSSWGRRPASSVTLDLKVPRQHNDKGVICALQIIGPLYSTALKAHLSQQPHRCHA